MQAVQGNRWAAVSPGAGNLAGTLRFASSTWLFPARANCWLAPQAPHLASSASPASPWCAWECSRSTHGFVQKKHSSRGLCKQNLLLCRVLLFVLLRRGACKVSRHVYYVKLWQFNLVAAVVQPCKITHSPEHASQRMGQEGGLVQQLSPK